MSRNSQRLEYVTTETVELFTGAEPLVLECGRKLSSVTVAYESYGTLNPEGTNAILICHALTASAHAAGYHTPHNREAGWWDGLIGPGKAFDTEKYFVVCPNILGSCYGTTGPTSINPRTGKSFGAAFPPLTVRDIVRVQKRLIDSLGINRLAGVVGSSFGGMQALEWGIIYPEFCETVIPISTAAKQTAWCIALNTIARMAITSDPDWNRGNYEHQPANGLALARMVGMVSYRSADEFELKFGRKRQSVSRDRFDLENSFQIESYLHHQGKKMVERFDANTYICLTRAMDLHDVAYGRGGLDIALGSIAARTLCIGVSSDNRYPPGDQQAIVSRIPNAQYAEINSIHGHDAFLIEYGQLTAIISTFLMREDGLVEFATTKEEEMLL